MYLKNVYGHDIQVHAPESHDVSRVFYTANVKISHQSVFVIYLWHRLLTYS